MASGDGIHVGSVSVSVVPDARDFPAQLRREVEEAIRPAQQQITSSISDALRQGVVDGGAKARQVSGAAGSSSGGAFADEFKRRVQAALADLPKPRVGVDATEADAELADLREKLAALGNVRVGVDLSAAEALAELDDLRGRLDELGSRSPDINVRVDTARASAELEAIRAQVDALDGRRAKVSVDVESSGLGALSGGGGGLASLLGGGPSGSLPFGIPVAAALPLAGLAIPVGAAAAAGLAGVATTALAGGAGIGVLGLGISGVTSAVKALTTEQSAQAAQTRASTAAAGANADAEIHAAEAIGNARQALADATRQAGEQQAAAAAAVQTAEYSLTQAEQAETNAQQQLHNARQQAARDLESAANRAVDSRLAQRQATINVVTAEQAYAAVMASSASTTLQKQQAALSLAQAQQALVEANQAVTQASQDNATAQARGVNGAPAVVAADQAVASAHHGVQTATQAVATAQQQQRDVAITTAEQIQRAQQQLGDALRASEQLQDRTTASSSALLAAQQAWSRETPAAKAFAEVWVKEIVPAFDKIRNVALAGLLPGFTETLRNIAPLIAPLTGFVGGLARTLGDLFAAGSKALTDPFWTQFFGWVTRTAGPTLATFARIIGDITTGFAGLLEGFGPVVTGLGGGLEGLARGFASWGESLGTNSGFQSFLRYIEQTGPVLVGVLGNIGTFLGTLIQALAPFGAMLLNVLDGLSHVLALLNPQEILAIGVALAVAFGGPEMMVAALGAAFAYAYDKFQPFHDFIANELVPVLRGIFRDALTGVRDGIADIATSIRDHKPQMLELRNAFVDIVEFITSKVLPLLGPVLRVTFQSLGDFIASAVTIVATLVTAFNGIAHAAEAAWTGIRSAFGSGINDVIGLLNDFIHAVDDVLRFFHLPTISLIPKILGVYSGGLTNGSAAVPVHGAYAGGGVIPGYAPGVDSVLAMVSPGEAILRPEVTMALGTGTIHALNAAGRSGRLPAFSDGGVLGAVNHAIGSLAGDVSGLVRGAAGRGVGAMLDAGEIPLRAALGLLSSPFSGLGRALVSMLNTGATRFISGGSGGTGDTSAHGGDAAAAQAMARAMLPALGWGQDQWAPLVSLWNRESGWNYRATNPSSGAYGIPQSLPASKMASAGADWLTNPATQIRWGLDYIAGRYGSPAGAWGHETSFGWYDQGGALPPGPSLVYNGTGADELVAPRRTFEQIMGRGSEQNVTVIAQFGSETIEAKATRVVDRFIADLSHELAAR